MADRRKAGSRIRTPTPPASQPRPAVSVTKFDPIFALIPALTFLVYLPAVSGGMLWDDEAHITSPSLQSLHGLWRIWFDLGATQQYYPLLHSFFWFEHRLWGDSTPGYHLVNILLHALSACLVVLIVRRLSLPGAWLAGLVFAVHPVCVESVAWMSEQKSTLSGVFFLASLYAYLGFDRTRRPSRYILALVLFALALLSKSVTAMLPAALLVILWWKRGTLEWKRDVLPLFPWLVMGASAGLFTAWVERRFIGAQGAGFALSFLDHCLLAGRALWFYALKVVWPVNLMFFYPRWTIDAHVWWQYLFPAAVLALLAAFVFVARARRTPLAVLLLFAGTLFPALGFFNVYPFIYSWVADHFQYLATLALIVPLAAGLTLAANRLPLPARRFAPAGAAVLLVLLPGFLSWRESRTFTGIQTLWRETIRRNPEAWMPHYNLGVIYSDSLERSADAIAEFRASLRIRPDLAQAHNDLAMLLEKLPGRLPDAIAEFELALRFDPGSAEIRNNLGFALSALPDRLPEAVSLLEAALRIRPGYMEAHHNLGIALAKMPGRQDEAVEQLRSALRIEPDSAVAHNTLGMVLSSIPGQSGEAVSEFETALRLRPDDPGALFNLANTLAAMPGRLPDAIAAYESLLRANPENAEAHYSFALALSRMPDRLAAVIAEYEAALRLDPGMMEAHYNLALALSRIPGRMPDAISHLEAARRLAPDSLPVRQMLAQARAMRR